MKKPYLELRSRNSFGDIINLYFTWLKYNFKPYTNLYLRYNAISIILTLIGSYLLVTGFMGLASRDFRFGMDSGGDSEFYLYSGLIVLVIILGLTAILNYSFSSAYIVQYVKSTGNVNPKTILGEIKKRIGPVVLFIIIGFCIYVGYIIVSIILAFIPLLGMLAQYGLNFTISAIFGLAFTSLFIETKTVGNALNEGWSFTFFNFWRVVLFGLVIGILNLMITMLILSAPLFILGIYAYFSIESSIDITTSTFATIVFTIGFALFILTFIYSQTLSQIANGVLYFNLYEEKYNLFLRERIEQIGAND